MDLSSFTNLFNSYLDKKINFQEPKNLYDPVHYIMSIGGKRIRPSLTLLSSHLFGCDPNRALDASLCVEMFHNFTLIHDDIMDNADLRRGKETVHKKWNLNTGVLSGDALMILAYQQLGSYPKEIYKALMQLLTKTAIEVCEGQQMDMDFESRMEVSLDEYYNMIKFKTAVLLGCSLKMGSIVAGTESSDQNEIYSFGINLGLAFQLQDDYLDTFGGEGFGKRIGGDILEKKKTFLYINTLELAGTDDKKRLLEIYEDVAVKEKFKNKLKENPNEKLKEDQTFEEDQIIEEDKIIEEVRDLFVQHGVDRSLLEEIKEYTNRALLNIEKLGVEESKKELLRKFSMHLMDRNI